MDESALTKYSQSTVTGESWVRAKRIVIENPNNSKKTIRFIEEMLVNIGGKIISEEEGVLELVIDSADMSDTITIIDPTTGEPTGATISYQELYGILFSAYIEQATKRDATE